MMADDGRATAWGEGVKEFYVPIGTHCNFWEVIYGQLQPYFLGAKSRLRAIAIFLQQDGRYGIRFGIERKKTSAYDAFQKNRHQDWKSFPKEFP